MERVHPVDLTDAGQVRVVVKVRDVDHCEYVGAQRRANAPTPAKVAQLRAGGPPSDAPVIRAFSSRVSFHRDVRRIVPVCPGRSDVQAVPL